MIFIHCLVGFFACIIADHINILLRIGGCLGTLLLMVFLIFLESLIYFNRCLKLESNSLSIIRKRLFFKPRITIYKYEELKHAAIFYMIESGEEEYHYILALVNKSDETIKIFSMISKIKEIQLNHFKYLVDILNEHIKNT